MVNHLGHVSSPEFWPAATNSAAAIPVLVVSATKWNVATTEIYTLSLHDALPIYTDVWTPHVRFDPSQPR